MSRASRKISLSIDLFSGASRPRERDDVVSGLSKGIAQVSVDVGEFVLTLATVCHDLQDRVVSLDVF